MPRRWPSEWLGWAFTILLMAARAVAAPPAVAPAETADQPARTLDTEQANKSAADQDEAKAKFLRLSRNDDDEPVSLDTAIVHYVSADPAQNKATVDLIGVIHIGEKEYYEALNEELAKYDVVLYELVAPEGTKVTKGERRNAHPISALQGGMKSMLELELQLDHIDYQKEHFVHADMTPEGFSKSMEDRGENMLTMFFRMLGQSIAQQSRMQARQKLTPNRRAANDADMLLAMFDRNRSHKLKQLMAEQFEDLEGAMNMFSGPDGSTIITERNKVALEVLKKQLDAGKLKVAILYGAGHMPDMEERLLADFALKRDGERWLKAWNLEPKAKRQATGESEEKSPSK